MSYSNVLTETRQNQQYVYLPQYGFAALDKRAQQVWQALWISGEAGSRVFNQCHVWRGIEVLHQGAFEGLIADPFALPMMVPSFGML